MDTYIQALDDRDREDVANVGEDIDIEDQELEMYCERADITKYLSKFCYLLAGTKNDWS